MELFWELRQLSPDASAEADASAARRRVSEAEMRLYAIERRADKALLLCETLWTLLREKLSLSDEELLERVKNVDMTDGRLDGRVRRPPVDCPNCRRANAARLARCAYCGNPLGTSPFAV